MCPFSLLLPASAQPTLAQTLDKILQPHYLDGRGQSIHTHRNTYAFFGIRCWVALTFQEKVKRDFFCFVLFCKKRAHKKKKNDFRAKPPLGSIARLGLGCHKSNWPRRSVHLIITSNLPVYGRTPIVSFSQRPFSLLSKAILYWNKARGSHSQRDADPAAWFIV
jgi:hypothetical protein